MSHDVEPLETGVWLGQLRKLAVRRARFERELAASLRRGFHLAVLAPRPLRDLVACPLPESEFELLIESEAYLPAALALLGNGLNYALSHLNRAGRIEAEVWFSNEREGGVARATTAPVALFAAWLNCLLTLDRSASQAARLPSPPVRRRSLSERRPRLTEH